MDRILIILKKKEENGPRASSAPALGLNTIIFKHVYWYMQQISGERLQDHWSSCLSIGIACPHRGAIFSYHYRHNAYPYTETDREACNVFFVWEMLRPLLKGNGFIVLTIRPRGYKTFFMLSSAETKIYPAHKC